MVRTIGGVFAGTLGHSDNGKRAHADLSPPALGKHTDGVLKRTRLIENEIEELERGVLSIAKLRTKWQSCSGWGMSALFARWWRGSGQGFSELRA